MTTKEKTLTDHDYTEELLNSAIALDLHVESVMTKSRVTVVAILFSVLEAQSAVLEMQHQGLKPNQIAIIGKDYYQATEQLSNLSSSSSSINWESVANYLTEVLTKLGISRRDTSQLIETINKEKFLLAVVSRASEANQIRHVLASIGTVFRLIGVYQYLHN